MKERLNIAVCDDEKIFLDKAQQVMQKYMKEAGLVSMIKLYESGEKLLEECRKAVYEPEIVFMDIRLKDQNGIEISKILNTVLPDTHIVYLTNYVGFASDVYESRHSYFVLKDEMEERLPKVMEKLLRTEAADGELLKLPAGKHGTEIIRRDTFMFAERDRRLTRVHTTKRDDLMVQMGMDELEKLLPEECFVRCHNSFIVSLNFVDNYTRMQFRMNDGTVIPISRRYALSVKEAFLQWTRVRL